jgi:EmrB/QacA subfamily drug resistance transporter
MILAKSKFMLFICKHHSNGHGKEPEMVTSERRKWLALALLSAVQFMVVLDIAVVNVALPSIQVDLGFSQENLQWVISAYALVFGGLLLLGGRAADLLGRRRIFLAGVVVFTAASLLAGLAWSEPSLIGARALQGLGAAVISPAALSILSTTFAEGRERNIALGVWGAVGGFGAAAGVLLGGVLTDALSWEWIFFVNVPVGAVAFLLAPVLLAESRDAQVQRFDAAGAGLVTTGLAALVYAITQAGQDGWVAGQTVGFGGLALALLVGFVAWELRQAEPLMRFGILRTRTVSGANVAGFILGTALFSMFLMLTLYMQQVLGYSPMRTGVAYLAVAGTAIIWSTVAAQLVTRIGVKPVLVTGMASLTAGLTYFTQVSVGGSYVGDLLPGFLLTGLGIGFSFVPISIAALAGVGNSEAGLASGLFNTSQQIGGALGIAALSTIATSRTGDAVASGSALPDALVSGFTGAFAAGVVVAALGVVAAVTLIRRDELESVPEAEPVLDMAACDDGWGARGLPTRRWSLGGGGGNRTRVLRCGARASPGAACS